MCQETSNTGLRRGISRVGLRHEQPAIVDRHVESCIALVHGIKELLQPIIEGGAEIIVSQLQLSGRLIFNRAGFFSDLPFESFQALFVVATHFTYGQQVAALGIEQEEQAVEECQRGTEEWLEQVVALGGVQAIQVGRKLSSTPGIDDEAACQVRKNLKEDALFESLSQLAGIAFAFAHQAVQEAHLPRFTIDYPFGEDECCRAEKEPEVTERILKVSG